MERLYISLLTIVVIALSCVPPPPPVAEQVNLDLKLNSVQQKIIRFQDELLADSLAYYLGSKDAGLRYLSARAFASMSAKDHSEKLKALLKDTVKEVAAMAAYSIGQQRDSIYDEALVAAFRQKDSVSVNNRLNSAILEAVGKCGNARFLDLIATANTYLPKDTLLLLGQVRGIYRFGLRGIISTKGTKKMAAVASDSSFPDDVRIIAAHYLQRINGLEIREFKADILNAIRNSQNPDLKIALVESLRHFRDVDILVFLVQNIPSFNDDRLKIASVRAMKNFDYTSYVSSLEYLLQHAGPLARWVAADFLLENVPSNEAGSMIQMGDIQEDLITKVKLYRAAYRHLPRFYVNMRESVREKIIALYTSSENIGQTVEVIHALGEDILNLNLLLDIVNETEINALRTVALETIIRIIESTEFNTSNRTLPGVDADKVYSVLLSQFRKGDIAAVTVISAYAGNRKAELSAYGFTSGILDSVFQKISLPSGIEAKRTLGRTLSIWNDYDYDEIVPEFNHPIDFTLISGLPANPRANITTTKGDIRIEFFVDEAPGTVSSFLRLMKINYFIKKKFHRIVPNFVTQGGCNRGDGFGSLDYTLRSEFGPLYYDKAGYVGMASAGPHSESQQIFITHTATPHLDGRYTIFAKVIAGMDVVLKLSYEDYIINIRMDSI